MLFAYSLFQMFPGLPGQLFCVLTALSLAQGKPPAALSRQDACRAIMAQSTHTLDQGSDEDETGLT